MLLPLCIQISMKPGYVGCLPIVCLLFKYYRRKGLVFKYYRRKGLVLNIFCVE